MYVSCCFVIIQHFFIQNGGLLIVDFGVNATKRTLLRNLSICGAGATNTDTTKHCHIASKSTMTALVSNCSRKTVQWKPARSNRGRMDRERHRFSGFRLASLNMLPNPNGELRCSEKSF